MVCIAILGATKGLLYVGLVRGTKKQWSFIHAFGYVGPALLFMVPALSGVPVALHFGINEGGSALLFLPHMIWSWCKLRAEGYSGPPKARTAIVFASAYIAFAVHLWLINPNHSTLAWPFRYREMACAA